MGIIKKKIKVCNLYWDDYNPQAFATPAISWQKQQHVETVAIPSILTHKKLTYIYKHRSAVVRY